LSPFSFFLFSAAKRSCQKAEKATRTRLHLNIPPPSEAQKRHRSQNYQDYNDNRDSSHFCSPSSVLSCFCA
jgi:hypothetical protein